MNSPCPDTTELAFIDTRDAHLRDSIRGDIGAASIALHNGEWKGATVLAGSATEALLLWAILEKRSDEDRDKAIAALSPENRPRKNDPEEWSLHNYVEVARQLDLITNDCASAVRLAKKFRNLIHPGRAMRLAQRCDRATALSALAAVHHVVRDLS